VGLFLKLEMAFETQRGIERVRTRRLCRTGFCDDDVALLENSPWDAAAAALGIFRHYGSRNGDM